MERHRWEEGLCCRGHLCGLVGQSSSGGQRLVDGVEAAQAAAADLCVTLGQSLRQVIQLRRPLQHLQQPVKSHV